MILQEGFTPIIQLYQPLKESILLCIIEKNNGGTSESKIIPRLDNARINAMRTRYDLIFKSKILDFYQGKAITL